MREVSIGAAITAGFRLIGREPLAFLAWALFYAIVGLGPQFAGMAMGFDTLATVGASGRTPEALASTMNRMQSLQPLSLVTALISYVVLYGAVFRASLFRDDRRFLYLRLGQRELWIGLTLIVIAVMYFAAVFAMAIPLVILFVGFSAAGGSGAGVGVLIGVLLGLVGIGVVIWGAIRLSLSLPMSFADKNFRLPQGWRRTRGHAGRMFGVFATLIIMLYVIALLLLAAGAVVLNAFMPLGEIGKAFTANPAQLISKINPAAWVVVVAIWALFATWYTTMGAAALAELHRQLAGPDTADVFS